MTHGSRQLGSSQHTTTCSAQSSYTHHSCRLTALAHPPPCTHSHSTSCFFLLFAWLVASALTGHSLVLLLRAAGPHPRLHEESARRRHDESYRSRRGWLIWCSCVVSRAPSCGHTSQQAQQGPCVAWCCTAPTRVVINLLCTAGASVRPTVCWVIDPTARMCMCVCCCD